MVKLFRKQIFSAAKVINRCIVPIEVRMSDFLCKSTKIVGQLLGEVQQAQSGGKGFL